MGTPSAGRRGIFLVLVTVLLAADFTVATESEKVARLIGAGECVDCKNFQGVHVAVVCKNGNQEFEPEAMGPFTKDGKFNLLLPTSLLKEDGSGLKTQCFTQLFVTSKDAPCPTQQHHDHFKLVLSSYDDTSVHVFRTATGKLSFSRAACNAKCIFPHPFFKFPHLHPWKKLHPKLTLPPFPCPKFFNPQPIPPVLPIIPPADPKPRVPTPPKTPAYKPPTAKDPTYKPPTAKHPPTPKSPKCEPPTPKPPTYKPPTYKPPTPKTPTYKTPTYKPPTPKTPTYKPPKPKTPTYKPPTYKPPTPKTPTYKPPTYKPPKPKTPTYKPPTYKPPKPKTPTYKPPTYKPPPMSTFLHHLHRPLFPIHTGLPWNHPTPGHP